MPPFKIPLRHLKRLWLRSDCSPSDLSQTLAQYIGDCVRRRGWSRGGLELGAYGTHLDIRVGDGYERDNSTKVAWFVGVSAFIRGAPKTEETEELCLGLAAHIPREEVIDLRVNFPIPHSSGPCGEMHNLTDLRLYFVGLSKWFVEPDDRGSRELPCGLDYITVYETDFSADDWSPLMNFLSRRAAVGRRVSSLRLNCCHSLLRIDAVPQEVVETLKRMVGVLGIRDTLSNGFRIAQRGP